MAHQDSSRSRGIQRSANYRATNPDNSNSRDYPDSSAARREQPSSENIDHRGIPASSRIPAHHDHGQSARRPDDYQRRDDRDGRPPPYHDDSRNQSSSSRNSSRDSREGSYRDHHAVKQEQDADPPLNAAQAASYTRKRARDEPSANGNRPAYDRTYEPLDECPSPQYSPAPKADQAPDPPSFTLKGKNELSFDASFLKTLGSAAPAADELAQTIRGKLEALGKLPAAPSVANPNTGPLHLHWSHITSNSPTHIKANEATVQLREILCLSRDFLGSKAPTRFLFQETDPHLEYLVDFGKASKLHFGIATAPPIMVKNLIEEPDIYAQLLAVPFQLGTWGPSQIFHTSLLNSLAAHPRKSTFARAIVDEIQRTIRAAYVNFKSEDNQYTMPGLEIDKELTALQVQMTQLYHKSLPPARLGTGAISLPVRVLADIGAALLRAQIRVFAALSTLPPSGAKRTHLKARRSLNAVMLTIEYVALLLLQRHRDLDSAILQVHPCLPLMVNLAILVGLPLVNSRFSLTTCIAHSILRCSNSAAVLDESVDVFGEAIFRAISRTFTCADPAVHAIINDDASHAFPNASIPLAFEPVPKPEDTLTSFFRGTPVLQQGNTGQRMLMPSHVNRFILQHHIHHSRNLHAFTHWGPFIARLDTDYNNVSPDGVASAHLNFTWIAALMLIDVDYMRNFQLDLKTFLTEWCPGASTFTYNLPDCDSNTGKYGPPIFSCYGVAAVSFLHSKSFIPKDHVQLARLPCDWIAAVPDLYHWYIHNSRALLPDASCPFGELLPAGNLRQSAITTTSLAGVTFPNLGATAPVTPNQQQPVVDFAALLQQQNQQMTQNLMVIMQTMMTQLARQQPASGSVGESSSASISIPTPAVASSAPLHSDPPQQPPSVELAEPAAQCEAL